MKFYLKLEYSHNILLCYTIRRYAEVKEFLVT